MTRDEMLSALQADVDAWPQRVRDAGVKNSAGASYVPVPRNNEILRTPADAEATYAYMMRTWQKDGSDAGSAGWVRIIAQAGGELTWEYLMVDEARPYASLFSAEIRHRVAQALESDPAYPVWIRHKADVETAQLAKQERIDLIRAEMRSGKRERLRFPELDRGL